MAKKTEDSREARLKLICETINKGDFGGEKHDAVTYLGSGEIEGIEKFPSGCTALDDALGGGWPKGRFIEVYGPESVGKTTIVYQALAQYQKKYPDDDVALVDSEYSMDTQYVEALGVNVKYLLVNQPEYGEQALNIISQLIQSGVKFIIVDSVAALTPKSELEGDVGVGSGMAEQARIMSKALRRLTTEAGSRDVTIFWTNQIREKLGVMFGDKTTTPAGRALKHYASIRLKLDRIGTVKEKIDGEDVAVCNKTKAEVKKNKVAPPFRIAEFYITYGHGIDVAAELLDNAIKRKVITKRGSWLSFGDEQIANSRLAALTLLRGNKELCVRISAATEDAKAKGIIEISPEAESEEEPKSKMKKPKFSTKAPVIDVDAIETPEPEVVIEDTEAKVEDA